MSDIDILRSLAEGYLAITNDPIQNIRRDLWRKHNSLKKVSPLIYIRAFAWGEMPDSKCECADPFYRSYENILRYQLFWNDLQDDSIFEPWITMPAVYKCAGWGVPIDRKTTGLRGGAYKIDYSIKNLDDINKLITPWHEIDECKTMSNYQKLSEAIGDILPVNVDRGPAYRMWSADISTDLGMLRGIENFMLDMTTEPEWLHRLVGFMSDGILKTHIEAETAGDWGLASHQNQAMPYAEELPDPNLNANSISQNQIWGYMAAQEFACVSPSMHDEFLLQYQLPILKRFGLVAYGCCEDLTKKIDILKQIPNLRRIGVSPFADVKKCAEQIKDDYVFSYRPSPSDMVSYGLDWDTVKNILVRDLIFCKDCHVDITLKDVETVQGDPERVKKWLSIARNVIEKIWN